MKRTRKQRLFSILLVISMIMQQTFVLPAVAEDHVETETAAAVTQTAEAPETKAAKTEVQEQKAPETQAPVAEAPKPEVQETKETPAPATEAPKPEVQETKETPAPATEAPKPEVQETQETPAPATEAPVTEAPQTEAASTSSDDVSLLAAIIYCEAGNQSYEGMVSVGAVVMNRVYSSSFPNSISEVIYQSGQFTPASSGVLASALANGVPSTCYDAAVAAMNGENPVGSALYFNTGSGKGIKIGAHQFY